MGLTSSWWLALTGFPASFFKSFHTMSFSTKCTPFIPSLPLCLIPYPLECVTMCSIHSVVSPSGMCPSDYSCLPWALYKVIHSCFFKEEWGYEVPGPSNSKWLLIPLHAISLPNVLSLIKVVGTKFTTTDLHALGNLITGCCLENRLHTAKNGGKATN